MLYLKIQKHTNFRLPDDVISSYIKLEPNVGNVVQIPKCNYLGFLLKI